MGRVKWIPGRKTNMKDQKTEIKEAMDAADEALDCLRRAQDRLASAKNWGILDILGGGLISTFMKQNRMSEANDELASARDALKNFASELKDVSDVNLDNIEVNDFLSFADYFFDGAIADWMIQSRISDARDQVRRAIDQIETIRDNLQAEFDKLG